MYLLCTFPSASFCNASDQHLQRGWLLEACACPLARDGEDDCNVTPSPNVASSAGCKCEVWQHALALSLQQDAIARGVGITSWTGVANGHGR